MRSRFAFAQFGAAARRRGGLGICLALCWLAQGLSANAQNRKATIVTFDPPGSFRRTFAYAINPAGAITGYSS